MATKVDCTLIVPEAEDSMHEGCPVLTKRRNFLITKGQCGTAQWQMRWPDGQIADLSDCFPTTSASGSESTSESASDLSFAVRFQGACDRGRILKTVEATLVDAEKGLIQFDIPPEVCRRAGIYMFQAALLQDGQKVVFHDTGLVSVEHGLWGDITNMSGPPTIQEIRFHLRDRAVENDLLQDVEFDDAEILEAIRHPVMYFNEVPPPLSHFTCNNFPYRHHWRNAIVAELLFVAAHHYVRNKMKSTSGGLTVDDKAREQEYLTIAAMYKGEWQQFVRLKKIELNANLAYGSQESPYGAGYYGR